MPIRNEAQFIATSLEAVLEQDYPAARMEVLVADGMSTDGTREIVHTLQERYPNVRLVANPGEIVAAGLNAAISQARGEVIVRVDGHTVINRDYVRCCVACLDRSHASCVGGRMDPVGCTRFGKAVALATSSPFGVGSARFHYSDREEFVDTVYMGAWRRETFERVGAFDEEQVRNQDDEFSYRLRSRGGTILLCPSIKSLYYNRSSPWGLCKQYFQYGYWKVRVMQKQPRQMRPRQFAPAALLIGLIVTLCLIPISRTSELMFNFTWASYLVANLAASAWNARKTSWRVGMLLPITFASLHFSYGLGFLIGSVRFWNRWSNRSGVPAHRIADTTVPLKV